MESRGRSFTALFEVKREKGFMGLETIGFFLGVVIAVGVVMWGLVFHPKPPTPQSVLDREVVSAPG
jgi:hypothetical protein